MYNDDQIPRSIIVARETNKRSPETLADSYPQNPAQSKIKGRDPSYFLLLCGTSPIQKGCQQKEIKKKKICIGGQKRHFTPNWAQLKVRKFRYNIIS